MMKNFSSKRNALLALGCLALCLPVYAQDPPTAGGQNPAPMRCPMCGQVMGPNAGNRPMMQHQPGMMMGMQGQNMNLREPAPQGRMGQGPQPGMMGMGMGRGMGMLPRRAMRPAGPMQGMIRQPQPEPPNPPGLDPLLRNAQVQKELGITSEQRQKLQDIGFESAKAGIQAKASAEVLKLELDRLIGMENPDKAAIDKKLQEISQAQTAMMRANIMARLDERNVLTKEQRARLPEVIQKLRPQPPGQPMPQKQATATKPAP
jgi:Spy/CpxP family protein refolding chaperone